MKKRVAISGVGVISPAGIGKENFWTSIIAGRSNVTEIREQYVSGLNSKRGFIINNFDFYKIVKNTNINIKRAGRGAQFSLASAVLALEDANLELGPVDPRRVGVAAGTTMGESQSIEKAVEGVFFDKDDSCNEDQVSSCCPSNIALYIARELGINGPITLLPAACAAGNYAISYACQQIELGRADVMIAGGSEPFSKMLHIGFSRLKLVAPEICQPFDVNRKGLMVSEGAGMLLLEEFEHAKKRGAFIYGEVLGYGHSCDAHHVAAPEPGGRGAVLALKRALEKAKLSPGDIQYISAHGTGTPVNDTAETMAIKEVFGAMAKKIPVSSIKSIIGHSMGAAGAVEAVLCALILERGAIPPTINYHDPDPLCDLDYVPNTARELPVKRLVSNSYGFYGNNSTIVMASC